MGILDEIAAEKQADPMIASATGEPTNYAALGEMGVESEPILAKAARGLMTVAHYTGVDKVLGLTAEGLGRTDEAFRAGVLTAAGKIPLQEFPQYWRDAWDGKHRLQSRDFLNMLTSKEFMAQLDAIPVDILPKWTSAIIAPEAHLAGERPGKPTMGDLFAFSADFWATPFAAAMFTPVGLEGRLATTAVGRAALSLTSPFNKLARAAENTLTGPKSFVGGLLLPFRDPAGALPEKVLLALKHDEHAAGQIVHGLSSELDKVWKSAGIAKGSDASDALGRWLAKAPGKVTPEIEAAGERVLDALEPVLRDAADQGHVAWDRSKRLSQFLPRQYGAAFEKSGLPSQTWSFSKLGVLKLGVGDAAEALKKVSRVDGWDYAMDVGAGAAWKNTFNRKVWVEKEFTRKVGRHPEKALLDSAFGGPDAAADVFDAAKTQTYKKRVRVNDGSLLKYRVWDEAKVGKQNPLLAGMTKPQLGYLTSKINDLTGHSRGRWAMIESDWIQEGLSKFENQLQRNRVSKYIYSKSKKFLDPTDGQNLPMLSKPQRLAMVMTHNVTRSFLGGNLGYAIKNTGQVLNSVAVHGVPKTIEGIFRMNRWFGEGKDLADLRKWGNVGGEFQQMLTDGAHLKRTEQFFDNWIMAPGRWTENWPRGIAFNIGAEEYAKKAGFKTVREAIAKGHGERMVKAGLENSWDQNFMYGMMGRPSLLSGPIMRPATTLLSYPAKQAEFWRRALKRDGSAFIRGLSSQGWAIDTLNQAFGVNAESWLGWGFKPPIETAGGIPMIKSPQVEFLTELIQGFSAIGEGDEKAAEAHFRKARGPIGQIFNQFDMSGDATKLQDALAAGVQLGMMPAPVIAIAKSAKLYHEFKTGERVSADSQTFTPVTKEDALASYFVQTQRAHNEQLLRDMTTAAKRKYDATMSKRVRKFYDAANGQDGDELRRAAQELATPISLPGGVSMFPDPKLVQARMEQESLRRTVPREVLAMHKAGWLMDVYAAEYIDAAFRAMAAGR